MRIALTNIRYRLQWTVEDATIAWSLAPGFDHDLERVDGAWSLTPLDDGRTLARRPYGLDSGPGVLVINGGFVPQG